MVKVGICWIVQNICSSKMKLFNQIQINQTNPHKVSEQCNFCIHIRHVVVWLS